ncbi:hypothetical protein [Erythrobacter aureus]|nr:hypothetical protein [Erythrobacter aureus]
MPASQFEFPTVVPSLRKHVTLRVRFAEVEQVESHALQPLVCQL